MIWICLIKSILVFETDSHFQPFFNFIDSAQQTTVAPTTANPPTTGKLF